MWFPQKQILILVRYVKILVRWTVDMKNFIGWILHAMGTSITGSSLPHPWSPFQLQKTLFCANSHVGWSGAVGKGKFAVSISWVELHLCSRQKERDQSPNLCLITLSSQCFRESVYTCSNVSNHIDIKVRFHECCYTLLIKKCNRVCRR